MINCEIYVYSTSEHIAQIYAGFTLLADHGEIQLTYNFNAYERNGKIPFQFIRPYDLQGVFVILNKNKTIFYDTTDGANLIEEAIEMADLYFKRSYLEEAIPNVYKKKVFPLGLNYEVNAGIFNKLDFYRFLFAIRNYKRSPKEIVKCVLRNTRLKFNPTIKNMHSPPNPTQKPRVLFMARTWDGHHYPFGMSDENKENWKQVCNSTNETKAAIIRILGKELGDRFHGGFARNDYAEKYYKDIVLQDKALSNKKNYVAQLHNYPICIATTGLYNSTGWKFAEYIAFSKAIVSEKLYYTVPGKLTANNNYLEFNTINECVKQTLNLFDNNNLRGQIMENNYTYYEKYLSPDKLIQRTLDRALNEIPV